MRSEGAARALAAVASTGIAFSVTVHDRVANLEQAAAARGLTAGRVLKSIVIRRGEDDYLFVLVPGGRSISWPKLRALLGVNRLSMPDAATARSVTGYERGAITPFGSSSAWPVIADAAVPPGLVSIGGGEHGTAFTVDRAELLAALAAIVADVTNPDPPPPPSGS